MSAFKFLIKSFSLVTRHVPSQLYSKETKLLLDVQSLMSHYHPSRQNTIFAKLSCDKAAHLWRCPSQILSFALKLMSIGYISNFKGLLSHTAAVHQNSDQDPNHKQTHDENIHEKRQKYQKWYQTSKEFKVISSIIIAAGSYFASSYFDKKRAVKEMQLQLVSEQIKQLYGPLYGNRLVQEKTYRAVMGEYGGLKNYLKKAEETKDAEMIRRWRSFVCNVLYPLDKEAEDLITRNSHLIAECEFPVAFDHFLNHIARLKFVMERHWKAEDGRLESAKEFTQDDFLEEINASGDRGVKEMLEHVEKKYKELRDIQKKLKVEVLIEENGENNLVHQVVNKFVN